MLFDTQEVFGCRRPTVGLPVEAWIKDTQTGSMASCLLGTPKLSRVSLWTYIQSVWKPKNRLIHDKCEITEDLWISMDDINDAVVGIDDTCWRRAKIPNIIKIFDSQM
jgi:hypothetical protein